MLFSKLVCNAENKSFENHYFQGFFCTRGPTPGPGQLCCRIKKVLRNI